MHVPTREVFFSHRQWKQSLANDGMYAYTKGVAGIVSNTHRIPIDAVSSDVKDMDILRFIEDDADDDDTTPMVHFHYPLDHDQMDPTTLNKEFNDELMSILNQVFNNIDTDMDEKEKNGNADPSESSEQSDTEKDHNAIAGSTSADATTKDESDDTRETSLENSSTASEKSTCGTSDTSFIMTDKVHDLEMKSQIG